MIMIELVKTIVDDIYNSSLDEINLQSYCENKIKQYFKNSHYNDLKILDILDEILEKVKGKINNKIQNDYNKGLISKYEFINYPNNTLQSYSKKHKEQFPVSFLRTNITQIIKTINNEKYISWQKFEILFKYILSFNGVEKMELTKTNQEGIDFFGIYNMGKSISSIIIPTNYSVKIVGQVKHYSKKIEPEQIRAFQTYCEDVKNNKENIVKSIPKWFKDSVLPVLGIYMTTSDFTKGTKIYANEEWMVLRNGLQIVESLIQSPFNKKWIIKKNGVYIFDKKIFSTTFEKNNLLF